MSQTHVYTHYNVYLVSNLPNRPQPSPAPTLPYHVLKSKRKNLELHSFLNHQFLIQMESFFRNLSILPIICLSVDIFTVGGHSDAFGDVTVMDEEASSSVSSSLALSPWFAPDNFGLLGDFGERWPISTFSVPFSETAGGWSNGLVFDIRDSPSWKISSKKQSWMSFSSYQDEVRFPWLYLIFYLYTLIKC